MVWGGRKADATFFRLEQTRAASNSFSRLFQGLFDENRIERKSQQDLVENILTPFYQTSFTGDSLDMQIQTDISMLLNSHLLIMNVKCVNSFYFRWITCRFERPWDRQNAWFSWPFDGVLSLFLEGSRRFITFCSQRVFSRWLSR